MNLLITGAWTDAKKHIEEIEQMGNSVVFMQYEKDECPCLYSWVEGIIGNGIFLSHPIEKFTNLKYIQLTSVGFDRVNMDYVKEHNIQIHNARGVYSIPMAEFALTGVLEIYKQMNFFRENQKKNIWIKNRDLEELYNKTVCIIGCGNVGNECAKRFNAFGCNVIGIDLFPRFDENYQKIYPINELKEVIKQSDINILTLPLTKETKYLIDDEVFKCMKTNSILVNIARGQIVDTNALLQNLDKLKGVVLDVFEEEPLDEQSELWNKENAIITPHNSFVGNGNQNRLSNVIMENLKHGC